MKLLRIKKGNNLYQVIILLGLLLSILSSCTKDYLRWSLPEKAELEVSVINISEDEIQFKGEILNDNIGDIVEVGFLVVRGNDFSLAEKFIIESFSEKVHTFTLSEFDYSNYYEVQFYVISDAGESKSKSKGFVTPNIPGSPTVVMNDYSGLSLDNVTVSANVTLEGSDPEVTRGFCWSTTPNPIVSDALSSNGSGIGTFSHNITNLNPETTYYISAFANNQIATSYSNQIEITTEGIGNLAFGDFFQGGIFFYLLQPGDVGYVQGELNGLVADPQDQGKLPWGCSGLTINTTRDISSGWINTQNIISACNQPNIAAKICNDLSINGFNDWYLPSSLELELMYQNLYLNGLGNFNSVIAFNDDNYWSSTSVEFNSNNALIELLDGLEEVEGPQEIVSFSLGRSGGFK